jgi:hypothetical protein
VAVLRLVSPRLSEPDLGPDQIAKAIAFDELAMAI